MTKPAVPAATEAPETFHDFWNGFGKRMVAAGDAVETIAQTAWHAAKASADDATTSELERLREERDEMLAAVWALALWWDEEESGCVYPEGMHRDSPGGNEVWKVWWDRQLGLCEDTKTKYRAAIANHEARTR